MTPSQSAACFDCATPYHSWPDFYVEPEVWLKYGPHGHEGGLLCLNCFAQRMAVHADARKAAGDTFVRINPTFAAKITGTAIATEARSAGTENTGPVHEGAGQ